MFAERNCYSGHAPSGQGVSPPGIEALLCPCRRPSPGQRCRRLMQRLLFISLLAAWCVLVSALGAAERPAASGYSLFARTNLVAWCIVPFDAKKRGPEERAALLEQLGFKMFAYDYRAEHI